jgi:hypothetical protein
LDRSDAAISASFDIEQLQVIPAASTLTVAQALDVIETTCSGSPAKKRHEAQDLSTMSS